MHKENTERTLRGLSERVADRTQHTLGEMLIYTQRSAPECYKYNSSVKDAVAACIVI